MIVLFRMSKCPVTYGQECIFPQKVDTCVFPALTKTLSYDAKTSSLQKEFRTVIEQKKMRFVKEYAALFRCTSSVSGSSVH